MQTQSQALGECIHLDKSYEPLWAYIPHFIHTPFYVYAYAFGDCLVNSLFQVWKNGEKDLTLKFYEAIKKFDLIANNKDYQWRHILKPGELLIFNNWRILHGRGSFNGVRKMSGCYINKEDFDSSCKLNGIN